MNIASPFLAILGIGPTELIVVLIILLLLFGGSKLPGLAKGLGQSIREFKKASKEGDDETKPVEKKAEPSKPNLTNGSN